MMSTLKSKDIKRMSPKEFMDLGLLQEVNRLFLHPMGLALEVVVYLDNDSVVFGQVWDYRDDPDGMIFGDGVMSKEKTEITNEMFLAKRDVRLKNFGWHIQPPVTEEGNDI